MMTLVVCSYVIVHCTYRYNYIIFIEVMLFDTISIVGAMAVRCVIFGCSVGAAIA